MSTKEIFRRPELYRAMLIELVERASNDDVLASVGAGPMECIWWGNEDWLSWLEVVAERYPGFRRATANLWVDMEVSEATMARLDAIAGTALRRVRPAGA